MKYLVVLLASMLLPAHALRAQEIRIPANIDALAARAVNSVNVTVDGGLLQLAGKFLSSADPEQRLAKNIIANLKGIYVRSFEFAGPGEYSNSDVESLRSQLKSPAWTRMASVRSTRDGEDVDVFLKREDDKIAGVVVIAAQPTRLTFVNIEGPVDLDQLARLGGQFGIPKVIVDAPGK
jgi:hypothetical protein